MDEEAEGGCPYAVEPLLPPRCLHLTMLPNKQHQDQEDYLTTEENLEPPSPRTQTDLQYQAQSHAQPGMIDTVPACQPPTAWQ